MANVINTRKLCMGCMSTLENPNEPCPKCRYDIGKNVSAPHQLKPFTILSGKYLVGRVLGEGGFGITYLGWDLNLDVKIAIKEYYPTGLVTRETTSTGSYTVTPFSGNKADFYQTGLDKFVNEAKSLAKFYNLPGIVAVKDFFRENGTAYIVMEFINGITLKQHLANSEGKLRPNEVFELMRPLMKSLSQIHAEGIIHRDISPDNIMLTSKGEIKLLDFGAARDFISDGNKSLSVLLKPGYAPEEQYRTKGHQGPWTDVYALCATIYKMLTGITPPESLERFSSDELIPPSKLGIELSPQTENALLKGLAVFEKDRYQSIDKLYTDIYGATKWGKIEPISTEVPLEQKITSTKDSTTVDPLVNALCKEHITDTVPNASLSSVGKKNLSSRKKFIIVGISIICAAVVIVVFIFMSGLTSKKNIAEIPKDSSQNTTGKTNSDSPSPVKEAPASTTESKVTPGKFSDKDIAFTYPKEWVLSTNSAGHPLITGLKDGLQYQLSVVDVTTDTTSDIFDYTMSKFPETPVPGGVGAAGNTQINNYSGIVTGCYYDNGGVEGSVTLYCITDGNKRVVIATWRFNDDNSDFKDEVYQDIIKTFVINK